MGQYIFLYMIQVLYENVPIRPSSYVCVHIFLYISKWRIYVCLTLQDIYEKTVFAFLFQLLNKKSVYHLNLQSREAIFKYISEPKTPLFLIKSN